MKTHLLTQTAVVGALLLAATFARAQTTVSNVVPVISIVAPDPVANEGGDPGLFVLHREGPTNIAVNVFLVIGGTASNGVDYAAIPNWIPIPAGVREVPIPVNPLVDSIVEGPETVGLRLVMPPTMIPVNYIIGTPNEAAVTLFENTNNPPPPNLPVVTVRTVDAEAIEPSPGNPPNVGVFRVSRDGPTNDALNVHYTLRGPASNGVDYALLPSTVIIPAGVRAADVVVAPLPDTLPEGIESVNLRLDDMAVIAIFPPPPGTYIVGTPREAALGIADNSQPVNHPPLARIVKPFDGQMFPGGVNIPIVVDTVDPDGYVPRVEFFADGNSLGVREKLFITPPPPGEHIGYELVWSNAPAGRHVLTARANDNDGAPGWAAPVCVWVLNPNLEPRVTITAADPLAAEGTNCLIWTSNTTAIASNVHPINTALFIVHRTGPTNDALTVFYHIGGTASNSADYLELPGVVTIPAGRRAAEIRVVPIDDALPEPIETVLLGLRLPPGVTNPPPPYYIGWPGRAGAVIVDNDGPRPDTGHLADRCFHITQPGANGQWFRIECSNDGIHWTPVCVNQVTDGAIHFVDAEADELPSRFYRCVPEQNPPAE